MNAQKTISKAHKIMGGDMSALFLLLNTFIILLKTYLLVNHWGNSFHESFIHLRIYQIRVSHSPGRRNCLGTSQRPISLPPAGVLGIPGNALLGAPNHSTLSTKGNISLGTKCFFHFSSSTDRCVHSSSQRSQTLSGFWNRERGDLWSALIQVTLVFLALNKSSIYASSLEF